MELCEHPLWARTGRRRARSGCMGRGLVFLIGLFPIGVGLFLWWLAYKSVVASIQPRPGSSTPPQPRAPAGQDALATRPRSPVVVSARACPSGTTSRRRRAAFGLKDVGAIRSVIWFDWFTPCRSGLNSQTGSAELGWGWSAKGMPKTNQENRRTLGWWSCAHMRPEVRRAS